MDKEDNMSSAAPVNYSTMAPASLKRTDCLLNQPAETKSECMNLSNKEPENAVTTEKSENILKETHALKERDETEIPGIITTLSTTGTTSPTPDVSIEPNVAKKDLDEVKLVSHSENKISCQDVPKEVPSRGSEDVINSETNIVKVKENETLNDVADMGIGVSSLLNINPVEMTEMTTATTMPNTSNELRGESPVSEVNDTKLNCEVGKLDDWDIPPSDNEDDGHMFEPLPSVILELYEKLEKNNILELEWKCLGRRLPDANDDKMEVDDSAGDRQEETVNQPVEQDQTEFDFDIDTVIKSNVTPRRIPGFEQRGSGSGKKKVAQMDKVFSNIKRFSRINEEMVKTGDVTVSSPSDLEVSAQRPLGKFHIRRDLHS